MYQIPFKLMMNCVFEGQIYRSRIDLWKSHGGHQMGMDYPHFCFSLEEKLLDKNVEISLHFSWLKLK